MNQLRTLDNKSILQAVSEVPTELQSIPTTCSFLCSSFSTLPHNVNLYPKIIETNKTTYSISLNLEYTPTHTHTHTPTHTRILHTLAPWLPIWISLLITNNFLTNTPRTWTPLLPRPTSPAHRCVGRREEHADWVAAIALVRHTTSPCTLGPHTGAQSQSAGGARGTAAEQLQRQRGQSLAPEGEQPQQQQPEPNNRQPHTLPGRQSQPHYTKPKLNLAKLSEEKRQAKLLLYM